VARTVGLALVACAAVFFVELIVGEHPSGNWLIGAVSAWLAVCVVIPRWLFGVSLFGMSWSEVTVYRSLSTVVALVGYGVYLLVDWLA
jgi:hypothetical protein